MSSRLIAPALLAAVVTCVTDFGAATSASASPIPVPSASALGVTTAVSRTIHIDGQSVQVILEVTRSDAAVSPPSTSVFVTLRTPDGQDLPVVNATEVRLERIRPPRRSFRQALLPLLTFRFDPTASGYAADGYPSFRTGTRLKAAIRLETTSGVRYVRFSDVRVGG